jgi:hypothetical protein
VFKLILVGLTGVLAALGGSQFGYDAISAAQSDHAADKTEQAIVQISTELTGVPILNNGEVSGYVVLRISSTIDSMQLPTKDFNVGPFLVDAGFRATFGYTGIPFGRIKPSDIEHLTLKIRTDANAKLGTEAVKQVNIEQFNYVPKAEIRGKILAPK